MIAPLSFSARVADDYSSKVHCINTEDNSISIVIVLLPTSILKILKLPVRQPTLLFYSHSTSCKTRGMGSESSKGFGLGVRLALLGDVTDLLFRDL